jgi:hypothetical protein
MFRIPRYESPMLATPEIPTFLDRRELLASIVIVIAGYWALRRFIYVSRIEISVDVEFVGIHASSTELVGEIVFWKACEFMVEHGFVDFIRAESVRFPEGHFRFGVHALNAAAG